MTQKQITSLSNNKRVDILPATINERKKEKKTKKKKADRYAATLLNCIPPEKRAVQISHLPSMCLRFAFAGEKHFCSLCKVLPNMHDPQVSKHLRRFKKYSEILLPIRQ